MFTGTGLAAEGDGSGHTGESGQTQVNGSGQSWDWTGSSLGGWGVPAALSAEGTVAFAPQGVEPSPELLQGPPKFDLVTPDMYEVPGELELEFPDVEPVGPEVEPVVPDVEPVEPEVEPAVPAEPVVPAPRPVDPFDPAPAAFSPEPAGVALWDPSTPDLIVADPIDIMPSAPIEVASLPEPSPALAGSSFSADIP